MEPFEEAVRTGDAAAVRALLTKQPELRAAIDRPAFDTAPAIVQRLAGITPATEEVAEAVTNVLKH